MAVDITYHPSKVSRSDRFALNGHQSCVVWLTGLSASGKSTLAYELEKHLLSRKVRAYVLDGDNMRHGLCKDLGFNPEDRAENIRRIGEVASLFLDSGLVVIVSLISPYREDRDKVRALIPSGLFVEIYVKCGVQECARRDPKGLYKKALAGGIPNFTGVSAPYEPPINPELTIDTELLSVEEGIRLASTYLESLDVIPPLPQ